MEEIPIPGSISGRGARKPYFRILYLSSVFTLVFLLNVQSAPGGEPGKSTPIEDPGTKSAYDLGQCTCACRQTGSKKQV